MDLFPRLYSISLQERTPISEYGVWDGSNWIWKFECRRQFFQWELDYFMELQGVLNQSQINREREDQIWCH